MCFVNNKIKDEALTITVTFIFVFVPSMFNYINFKIGFKILIENFEFRKIFSRLFGEKV